MITENTIDEQTMREYALEDNVIERETEHL